MSIHLFLKSILKSNRFFYLIYFYLFNSLVTVLKAFVKTDEHIVLFVSYGGKRCDDSPRVLYDYMQKHEQYGAYKCVWALINPNEHKDIPNRIKIDTLQYYFYALKAGYWITNSSVSRGLNLKQKSTKYYNYVHGTTGIKRKGLDIAEKKGTYLIKCSDSFDKVFIQSLCDIEYRTAALNTDKNIYCLTGLPRNDNLGKLTDCQLDAIKSKLGIPHSDKKIILYAPTFRENSLSKGVNSLPIPFDLSSFKNKLEKDYILVITAHYEVAKLLGDIKEDGFAFNAFDYPYFDELLQIADVLITDYSSCAFDFSIKCKPILCYGYDYDHYLSNRGFYTDLEKLFCDGVIRTQQRLEDILLNMDYNMECEHTQRNIKEKYINACGEAAKKSAEIIFGK